MTRPWRYAARATRCWCATTRCCCTACWWCGARGRRAPGGGVQSTFNSQPQAVRDRLRVIYTTTKVPPHPVVAHPRVPAAARNKVRQAFLDMGATPAGQALLPAVPIQRIGTASARDYAVSEQLGLQAV